MDKCLSAFREGKNEKRVTQGLPESDLVSRKSANRFRETFDNLICYDYLLDIVVLPIIKFQNIAL